jgi:hypothetical protein
MTSKTSHQPGELIGDPETEDTHYGISITHVGEDGNMLALGHHDPRKALAAFNKHARTFLDLPNLADDFSARAANWLDAIRPRWAVFTEPDPEQCEDPEWFWVAHFSDAAAPNAQPIMHLDAHAACHPQQSCRAVGASA